MDGRKFRKISDDVFQAITSSDDEKGTEYVRDLQQVSMILDNLEIRSTQILHDKPWDFGAEKELDIFKRIEPAMENTIQISANVEKHWDMDLIYVAVPDSDDDSVHSVIFSDEGPHVHISHNRQPLEGHADHGVHYISTVSGYDGDVYLDISLPKNQIIALVKDLREAPDSTVIISLYLDAFGRTDQAWIPHRVRREYLVEKNCIGFVDGVIAISKHGAKPVEIDTTEVELQQHESNIQREKEEIRYTDLIKSLESLQRTILMGFVLVLVFIVKISVD